MAGDLAGLSLAAAALAIRDPDAAVAVSNSICAQCGNPLLPPIMTEDLGEVVRWRAGMILTEKGAMEWRCDGCLPALRNDPTPAEIEARQAWRQALTKPKTVSRLVVGSAEALAVKAAVVKEKKRAKARAGTRRGRDAAALL